MIKNTKVEDKNTELVSILSKQFEGKVNLARIKFISMFICALCKVQTVGFEKLANAFDSVSDSTSSLRRIQRFIAEYSLNSNLVAQLIFKLLPEKEKLCLSIDRTNWKFGKTDINIFMLGVCYNGLAFPLLFTMLKKQGNSNSQERINLIKRFVKLFGKECIESVLADREFVGDEWITFLNDNKIPYYIRIRNNFKVFIPHKNKELKASWLFNATGINEFIHYRKIIRIGTQLCYLSGCKLKNKKGKPEFLIIISFNKPDQAQAFYKQRWQIETCFKAMKTSGFDIEKTHLQEIDRIEKLILLVMIAFVWCYKVGIYLNLFVKPITIKKHGRKAQSIFKYGLSSIAKLLLNKMSVDKIDVFSFLSCT